MIIPNDIFAGLCVRVVETIDAYRLVVKEYADTNKVTEQTFKRVMILLNDIHQMLLITTQENPPCLNQKTD